MCVVVLSTSTKILWCTRIRHYCCHGAQTPDFSIACIRGELHSASVTGDASYAVWKTVLFSSAMRFCSVAKTIANVVFILTAEIARSICSVGSSSRLYKQPPIPQSCMRPIDAVPFGEFGPVQCAFLMNCTGVA